MTTARDYFAERTHARLTPGASLKIARELQGMSQSALARVSGIPQPAISAFESGQEDMGIKRIKILAAALKVHPAVIAFPNWEAEVIDLFAALRRSVAHDESDAPRRTKVVRRRHRKA